MTDTLLFLRNLRELGVTLDPAIDQYGQSGYRITANFADRQLCDSIMACEIRQYPERDHLRCCLERLAKAYAMLKPIPVDPGRVDSVIFKRDGTPVLHQTSRQWATSVRDKAAELNNEKGGA